MADVLELLEQTIRERRATRPPGSYTTELLADPERLRRKIMEEAFEVTLELGRAPVMSARVAEEAADLVYHLLVGLVAVDVPLTAVFDVLEDRRR